MLLIILLLLPLLGGAAVLALRDLRSCRRMTVVVTALTAAAATGCALGAAPVSVAVLWLSDSLTLSFGVDGLSRFFLILVAGVWCVVLPYALAYMSHEGKERQFYGFFTLTLAALMALATAQNMVTLYMCFELMTLLSMPLVLHNGTEVSRLAALKYLGFSVLGAALALLGFFFFASYADGTAFVPGGAELRPGHEGLLTTAYFLTVLGFGCKAGLVPLQAWLTEAHPVAPSPASAVLSGIITKGGVLAVIRVTFYLFGADFVRGSWAQELLLILALVTVFTGSMLALRAKLLKQRLAFSTISQVSYVLFGLLLLNIEGFTGALLQIVFHALAKDALFLTVGAIILATGVTRVGVERGLLSADLLRGVGRRMPVTLWCFAIGAFSLFGLPLTGGFVSKWHLAMGALEETGRLGLLGVAVLLVSALLTAFYLFPIITQGFFPGHDAVPEGRCEAEARMLIPMLILCSLAVILGIFPGALTGWIQTLAGGLL